MSQSRVPDDDDLARLIATAFDALPGPDEERLAAIGGRLEQQHAGPRKGRHARWLWLWLLLAGGTVAATWWAGEYLAGWQQDGPAMRESGDTRQQDRLDTERDATDRNGRPPESAPDEHRESPIIYRRSD